jgi:ABC-type transporter Mla MlaB component
VNDSGNVQLDASAVQRVDTASLQVLAAFARDRRADGLPLEWLGVPACLTDAATLLDLTNALGLPA